MSPVEKRNIVKDRKKGAQTEISFCNLMQRHGYYTHRFQESISRAAVFEKGEEHIVMPDVWVIPKHGNQFLAEVKGKYPNQYNAYGLEKYRVDSLEFVAKLTNLPVMYVIFDTVDEIWYWANMVKLIEYLNENPDKIFFSKTYSGGEVKRLPTGYFPKSLFYKLELFLESQIGDRNDIMESYKK